MKSIFLKKIVLPLATIMVSGVSLYANDNICDESKINSMFNRALSNGATIVEKTPSESLNGFCEVILKLQDRLDLVYANTNKNLFLANTLLIKYDENIKDYAPLETSLNKMQQKLEEEKTKKVQEYLKDKKVLDEYYALSTADKSLRKDRKYDVLLFESRSCGYCAELKSKLKSKFKTDDIGIYRIELPMNMEDYNYLKDDYYKSKEKLDKVLAMKEKVLEGVPLVIIRDAKTKEFVEIFRNPSTFYFDNFVNYIEAKK